MASADWDQNKEVLWPDIDIIYNRETDIIYAAPGCTQLEMVILLDCVAGGLCKLSKLNRLTLQLAFPAVANCMKGTRNHHQ